MSDWFVDRWLRRCAHASENVAADILDSGEVKYCRRCGAVRPHDSQEWRRPRPLEFPAVVLALALLPGLAFGQGVPTFQEGQVLQNDIVKATRNGLVRSGTGLMGDNNGRGLNPFSITTSTAAADNPGLCFHTGPTIDPVYSTMCFGNDSSGHGRIALSHVGAGPAPGLIIGGSAGVRVGNASGGTMGLMGTGTLNAQGLYVNGLAVLTNTSNTFESLFVTGTPTLGSALKVGTQGWMTTINGSTEVLAQTSSLSNIGGIGVMGASRSSNYTGLGPASQTIGLMGYGLNDYTGPGTDIHAWGGIVVGRRALGIANGHQAIGFEVDIHENNNMAGSNFITPNLIPPTNGSLSAGLWVASGDGYSGTPFDASVAIGIIPNGAKFMSGIVFSGVSLVNRGPEGQAYAIELAEGHALRWTTSTNGLAQMLWADPKGLRGIGNHGAVMPPSYPTSWALSGNYYAQGDVNFWNAQDAPGPRVFAFHKKITNTTEQELVSINWGGEVRQSKGVVSVSGPGAGYGAIQWVQGTNAGTCKLVATAGTSTTPVTIVDNVGAGC